VEDDEDEDDDEAAQKALPSSSTKAVTISAMDLPRERSMSVRRKTKRRRRSTCKERGGGKGSRVCN
jgi:hypothetical protein